MTRSKRPKLGEVLRGGEPVVAAPVTTTPPEPPQQGRGEVDTPAPVEKPVEKMVQLNVTVPPELRRAVRIKALQEGVEVSAVVRELLQAWLNQKS
ncbi:hypothetical protein [Deinococcus aestuarii]|uniref:hypothetical protein n=1 Tax=Deinococcus aestuarii TaxID=2774531 RepID=UPI001C0DB302|nr:hypothetical protein [Deinococcus aestuarii]